MKLLSNKLVKHVAIASLLASSLVLSTESSATDIYFVQRICFNLYPDSTSTLWMGTTSQNPYKNGSPSGNPHINIQLPDGKTSGDWNTNSQPQYNLTCAGGGSLIPNTSQGGSMSDSNYTNVSSISPVRVQVTSPNFTVADVNGNNGKDGLNCGTMWVVPPPSYHTSSATTSGSAFISTSPSNLIVVNVYGHSSSNSLVCSASFQ